MSGIASTVSASSAASEKKNIRIFVASGTFVAPKAGTYKFWALAAGASGGARHNCSVGGATGGGGGELRIGEVALTAGQSVLITIGAGGAAVTDSTAGNVGGDTTISSPVSITAKGGSAGATIGTSTTTNGGAGGTGGTGGTFSADGGRGGTFTQTSGTNIFATGGGAAGSIWGAGGHGGDITGTGITAQSGGGAVGVVPAMTVTTSAAGTGAGVGGTGSLGTPGPNWQGHTAAYEYVYGQLVTGMYNGFTTPYGATMYIGPMLRNPLAEFYGGSSPGGASQGYSGTGAGGGAYNNPTTTHYGATGGTCGGGGAAMITTVAGGTANGGRGGRGAGGAAAVTAFSNSGYDFSGAGGDGLAVVEWD